MKLTEVIEQYIIDCENRGRAIGTIAIYRRHLGLLMRWLGEKGVEELEVVTLPLLREYLSFLLKSGSDERYEIVRQKGQLETSTAGTYVAVIKTFFNWCYQEELISSNLAARVKKPKVPKKIVPSLTTEQVEQLLSVCDIETRDGFRDYVIIMLFLDTGMRVSELCKLRASDVNPKYVKVSGKGQKEREIGIHPTTSKMLWRYIQKCRILYGSYADESDYVFLGQRGNLNVSGIEYIISAIKKKSGVEHLRVTPHVLRHTFSKLYLKRGGDLFKLSRELGHSTVQITGNVYLGDFKSADAREDHDRYSPIGDIKVKKIKRGKKE